MYPEEFYLGDRRLVGQHAVRKRLSQVLKSDRLGHAYLFSGNPGIGKTAAALAFAEALQGIDHLSDFQGAAFSRKQSWYYHPDIHVYFPIIKRDGDRPPRTEDLRALLQGLNEDPYASLDFAGLTQADEESRKKKSFYPIEYFRGEIRPRAYLTPNEGRFTVIVITRIETMKADAANAFLKALEEPSDRVIFILTADRVDALLPTILSRCQIVPFTPLSQEEIRKGLIQHYGYTPQDAAYLARISGGSFAVSRSHDLELFHEHREQVVEFFRAAYALHNGKLLQLVTDIAKTNTVEGFIRFLNLMEVFLHDVSLASSGSDSNLFTNADQSDIISKFSATVKSARLSDIFAQIGRARMLISQNISPRMVLLILGQRCHYLLRGADLPLLAARSHLHMPAFYPDL